jgi:hypothetical protein
VKRFVGQAPLLVAVGWVAGCGEVLLGPEVQLPVSAEGRAAVMVVEDGGKTWVSEGRLSDGRWSFPYRQSASGAAYVMLYPADDRATRLGSGWREAAPDWRACLGDEAFRLEEEAWVPACIEPEEEVWAPGDPIQLLDLDEDGHVPASPSGLVVRARADGGAEAIVLANNGLSFIVDDAGRSRRADTVSAVGIGVGGGRVVLIEADGQLWVGADVETVERAGTIVGPWESRPIGEASLALDGDRILALVRAEDQLSASYVSDWVAVGALGGHTQARWIANRSAYQGRYGYRTQAVFFRGEPWVLTASSGSPVKWDDACGVAITERPECWAYPAPHECQTLPAPCIRFLGSLTYQLYVEEDDLRATGDEAAFRWVADAWETVVHTGGSSGWPVVGYLAQAANRPEVVLRGAASYYGELPKLDIGCRVPYTCEAPVELGDFSLLMGAPPGACGRRKAAFLATSGYPLVVYPIARTPCTLIRK